MPGFVRWDPPEFDTDAMLHHEAGHVLLAYYYGFRIGRFDFIEVHGELSGRLTCQINPQLLQADEVVALETKTRQVLAGELAARLRAQLPNDRMVLPIDGAELVTGATPINALRPPAGLETQDTFRVLYVAKEQLAIDAWWNWLWTRHAETRQILQDNWLKLCKIAGRLRAAKPYQSREEQATGVFWNRVRWIPLASIWVWERGTGTISGDELVSFCRWIRVPIHNAAYRPVSYRVP